MNVIFKNDHDIELVHQAAKILGETEVELVDMDADSTASLIRQAGNKIASVHFVKRGDKTLRKMCYRLHVSAPKFANSPSGNNSKKHKDINDKNGQITVFDVNKVIRDKKGEIVRDDNGKVQRGAWRTIPLENVKRVKIDGITYQFTK